MAARDWYWTDYSHGFHDPEGFNKTASVVVWELRKALDAAEKSMSDKADK